MVGKCLIAVLLGALGGAVPLYAAAPVLSDPSRAALRPTLTTPARATTADRIADIAAKAEVYRERAVRPGLGDEERDVLIDKAWALCDEVLGDPTLKDAALRTPPFLRVYGLLLLDDGEHEVVREVLERLRGLDGKNPETHALLALGFMEMGRPAEAIGEYRRALELGVADSADIRAQLAYALAAAGKRDEGLRVAAQAVAENPAGYSGYFIRGRILEELGRREEAKRDYERAVERYRDDADLWDLLGELHEEEGDLQRALECYREVVRIDPSDEIVAEKVRRLESRP